MSKMTINLEFVYNGLIAADHDETALAFLHKEAGVTMTLRCLQADKEIVCRTARWF